MDNPEAIGDLRKAVGQDGACAKKGGSGWD